MVKYVWTFVLVGRYDLGATAKTNDERMSVIIEGMVDAKVTAVLMFLWVRYVIS